MPEIGTSGSVRGAGRKARPYRDSSIEGCPAQRNSVPPTNCARLPAMSPHFTRAPATSEAAC